MLNILILDDSHFIRDLLEKIGNPRRRSAAREILVSRDRLEMENIIGRGTINLIIQAINQAGSESITWIV